MVGVVIKTNIKYNCKMIIYMYIITALCAIGVNRPASHGYFSHGCPIILRILLVNIIISYSRPQAPFAFFPSFSCWSTLIKHARTIDTILRDWKQVTCAHSTCTFFTSQSTLSARGVKRVRFCTLVCWKKRRPRGRETLLLEK